MLLSALDAGSRPPVRVRVSAGVISAGQCQSGQPASEPEERHSLTAVGTVAAALAAA